MGFRASWVAAKNVDLEAALAVVGLREEERLDEEVCDPGQYAVQMPDGWLVVIGDGSEFMDTVKPRHARELSRGTEALHFTCNDTTMCATLSAWKDGREVWGLEYVGVDGIATPSVSGTPPEIVGEVLARCASRQAEAGSNGPDYQYEAAAELGLALVGFRHDQTLFNADVLPISVLAPR